MRDQQYSERFGLRLTRSERKRLELLAAETHLSAADVVRAIINAAHEHGFADLLARTHAQTK